jgi:hypothetical protein
MGSHDADILVAADGLRSSVREMVFPEYPRPRYTGLIGTGGITEAEISDTGGLMRMTFGSNAFFGYLKPAGKPGYWFDSYAADESDIEKINNPTGYARDELVDAGRHALRGWKLRSENRGNSVILAPAIRRLNHCRPVATPRERRTPRKAI